MNPPLISIVIPAFNRAKIISQTLNSIVAQTYTNWECIIIDDHSTDSTFEIVEDYTKKDSRIKLFKRPNEKPKGANSARNFGLSKANGYYLIFFDSDDIMSNSCLQERSTIFSKNQDKDMIIFSMGIFKTEKKLEEYPNRKVINLNLDITIEEFILSDKLPWNICRPIFKTDLIKNKISFNEKMQNFQDDEFNLRVLGDLKLNYLSIDITDCYYRFDSESLDKYNNLSGTQNIVDCFFEYYKTVFRVLNKKQKHNLRKKIINKYFGQIITFVKPKINTKTVFQTLDLFNKEINLTTTEIILFYLIIYLNKFYFNKKGYYTFSQKLKSIISQ